MTTSKSTASRGGLAIIAGIILVIGYGFDQLTKYWVETQMRIGEIRWVIEPWFKWYSIRNPGAAFSMGEDFTWVFTVFMAVVSMAVVITLFKTRSRLWTIALASLLAGTLGNLTDRLFRPPAFGHGHVVDFISVGNFAIFNIADSLITCSVVAIVLLIWCNVPLKELKEQSLSESSSSGGSSSGASPSERGETVAQEDA